MNGALKRFSKIKNERHEERLIVALENHMAITEVIFNMFIHGDNSMKKRTESLISQIREELDKVK